MDEFVLSHQDNWFVREVLGMMRRTFARIDVTSRSIYAIVEPGSCFAGTLLELALAADRVYMRDMQEGGSSASMTLSKMNFGPLPMMNKTFADSGAILTATSRRWRRCAARLERSFPRVRRSTQAWLPPHRMISTGKTKSARPSNRVRRNRQMHSRGSKQIYASDRGDAGDADFRPTVGLAKLDIHPSERGWRERCAQGVWDGSAGEIQLGKSLKGGREPGLLRRSQ